VDNLQELDALKDAEGRFLLVNQAFVDDAGVPKEEIEGKSWADFVRIPEHVEFDRQRHQEVVSMGPRLASLGRTVPGSTADWTPPS
jgi:PAS domain S-box-containing protein